MVERLFYTQEVVGSIPTWITMKWLALIPYSFRPMRVNAPAGENRRIFTARLITLTVVGVGVPCFALSLLLAAVGLHILFGS